jgi:type I restriction enzyme S subunit
MRDGWSQHTLGEIVTIINGGTPSTKIEEYWGGEIVWITTTELTAFDGKMVNSSKRTITQDGLNSGPARMVRAGTTLVGTTATIGTCAMAACDLTFNQQISGLLPKTNKLDDGFLFYWIQFAKPILEGLAAGTSFKRISTSVLKTIEVKLPSLPEQRRIVDLISSVDSYIGALEQQLASAKRSRNAVLHEFMNGEGTAFQDTQLGQIAKFLNGKAYSKEELLTVGKYRVLRVGNFFSNNNWYWSDLELEPNKYCENGDLLYAWSASFGPRIWNEEKVIYHYHIWKVNTDESLVDKKWLFYWLEDDVERIKSASGSGSIMMHVTKSEMEKRAIRLPALSEQIRQLVILESFDQNIHTLETLIVSTSHLRSSMLSDLLSGIHEIPASYDKVIGAA